MLNLAVIVGNLAKPVEVRTLPSGTSVAGFDLQVLRANESPETVPVTLSEVREPATDWAVDEQLLVIGRVRRRFFRVGGSTQSRTEVVAERVLRLHRAGAVEALAEVGSTLDIVIEDLRQAPPGQYQHVHVC
jgi:single-strand DNA-binding protein